MNRPITPDIEEAVKVLQPICKGLGFTIYADGSVMTINDQKIGVSCNSTYATVMEGIGYLFYTAYSMRFRQHKMSKSTKEAITRYWIPDRQSEGSGKE